MAFYDWFGAGPQHESVFVHAIPYVPTLVLLFELHHTARRIGLNGGNQVQVGHACRCQSKGGNDTFKGRMCLLTEGRSGIQQHRFCKCKPTVRSRTPLCMKSVTMCRCPCLLAQVFHREGQICRSNLNQRLLALSVRPCDVLVHQWQTCRVVSQMQSGGVCKRP